MGKHLTAVDQARFSPVGDPQISPDGSMVAYVKEHIDLQKDETRSEIWLVAAQGGCPRRLTGGQKQDNRPRWSPDGKKIAFVSNRDGKAQIYLISPDGGEAAVISTKIEPASPPFWSPDRGSIAFVGVEEMKPESPFYPGAPVESGLPEIDDKSKDAPTKVIKTLHHRLDGIGFFGDKFRHIFIVAAEPAQGADVATRRLTNGRFNHDSPCWSPDGKAIVCVANRDLEDDDPVWVRHTWVFDVGTGAARRVLIEDFPQNTPTWSPDGKSIAFVGADHAFNWVSSPYHLFMIDYRPDQCPVPFGKARNLTASLDRWVGSGAASDIRHSAPPAGPLWSRDGKWIMFTVAVGGESHIYRAPADGTGAPERVTPGTRRGVVAPSLSENGWLAYVVSTPTTPDEVFVLSPLGAESRLTSEHDSLRDEFRMIEPERLSFKGPDGWDIEGWLMKPLNYEPGKKYPTILSVHGGPSGMYGYGFNLSFQTFAHQGFAVLYINPRGSSGYSTEFGLAVVRDWGGKDFEDIMAGVDCAVEMGVVDPDRLGVAGWSYGGFMTCWTVTHTNRFKAAVAGACIADLVSAYGTQDVGVSFVEFSNGGPPWVDPAGLMEQSSVRFADRVTTPMLLLHGEGDLRCPVSQADEVFYALQRQGKTCVFVRYPGEFHGLVKPRNKVDRQERMGAWFEHYLKR
ncbi:MAG: S9 family peptidase [Bacillota bacterium]|nr:S9 family peptidase [Bacillota bacterium]